MGRISIASVVALGSGLIVEGVEFLHGGGGVAHALVDGWCDAQFLRVEVGMGEKRLQRKAKLHELRRSLHLVVEASGHANHWLACRFAALGWACSQSSTSVACVSGGKIG